MLNRRIALPSDIEDLLLLLEDAKLQQKRQGVAQWNIQYPTKKNIEEDVVNGVLFMYSINEELIGAASIKIQDEILYLERVMVVGKNAGKGYASQIISDVIEQALFKNCLRIKVATNHTNFAMRKILDNNQFGEMGKSIKTGREQFGDFIEYSRLLSQ